ncbi:MAG: response regulator [Chitinophagaceae bacterium]|nr:response regulator [Oligoflexus sp.]
MIHALDASVLIVENNTDLAEVLASDLVEMGYRVVSAENAKAALEKLASNKIFLILSDFQMPLMNGVELCEQVRKILPALPFILITGMNDRDTAVLALRAGVNAFLSKPFDRNQLLALVKKHHDSALQDIEELKQIKRIFIEEARDLMSDFEPSILGLEDNPDDKANIDSFFRKLHTIKGSAASVAGGEKLSKLAHALENVLSLMKDGKLTLNPTLISHFLVCNDLIGSYLNAMDAGTSPPDVSDATLYVERLLAGELRIEPSHPSTASTLKFAVPPTEQSDGDEGVLVSAEKLDRFMDLAGDLVAFKNSFDELIRRVAQGESLKMGNLESMQRSIMKISDNIQTQIMDVRKVALSKTFTKFPRVVRQAAAQLQKKIRLDIKGQELAVDKTIAKALGSSLIHAVRNSCDHGIESPALRADRGKDPTGTIQIIASQIGTTVSILVKDDGGGLDRKRIIKKAIERELIDTAKAENLSDSEAYELLFLPGFSTAEKVSDLSGRGVGMDVIKTAAVNLGGTASLSSRPGQGMILSLSIPIPSTVIVEKSLLVKSEQVLIAIPLSSVAEIKPIQSSDLTFTRGRWTLEFRGETVEVGLYKEFLAETMQAPHSLALSQTKDSHLIVILSHKNRLLGLLVDTVLDQFEAVIRPFDSLIKTLPGFSGTALLPTNELAFVLSAESVIDLSMGAS